MALVMEWWPDLESLVFLPRAVMHNWFPSKIIIFMTKRTSYANGVLLMSPTFTADHMAELSQQ